MQNRCCHRNSMTAEDSIQTRRDPGPQWKCVCKSEKVYNVILDCVAVNGGDEEEQAKLKEQEIDYIEPTIDALVKTLGLDEAELRSMITDPSTSGSRYQVLKRAFLWKKADI